ncbi:hypothetical protein [Novosphingobium sp. KACC 22771]|uniref:hypothetical protein n=1 Tax=Novosphingobium sp. KACC 22771 TaxID=3025670 RepID=UPI0023657294|nr:hypothetical protein [Novosphingobium sp. KACC 22771]WDF72306.1 hypothetical protein PQ467_16190 [Novosphingobium sp. KACC 22771]
MGLLNCSFNPNRPLILDASVAINLNATGLAARILDAIPNPIVIVDVVMHELNAGRTRGRTDADMIASLVESQRVQLVSLSAECEGNFLAMVSGTGASTLDDGEAATISWAVAHAGIPVIDEKKGLAICRDRFPNLQVCTTTDLLAHEYVLASLGHSNLSDAIYNALTLARMRVREPHIPWVISTVGEDRIANCYSLPESARRTHLKIATND